MKKQKKESIGITKLEELKIILICFVSVLFAFGLVLGLSALVKHFIM